MLRCVWLTVETAMDQALQKRLTAFERAGVENYLYRKRCKEEGSIDKKADSMLQR